MHSQQPPGVVQNWSTLQCSKHDIEQCGYDHAPLTRGRMRTQFPLPHGPTALIRLQSPGRRARHRRAPGRATPPLSFWCNRTHHPFVEFPSTSSPPPESRQTLDVWATVT